MFGLTPYAYAKTIKVFEEFKVICMGTSAGNIFLIDTIHIEKEERCFVSELLYEN